MKRMKPPSSTTTASRSTAVVSSSGAAGSTVASCDVVIRSAAATSASTRRTSSGQRSTRARTRSKERARDRDRPELRPISVEGACELEREHRVSARGFVDAREHRPRKGSVAARADEMRDRAEAQRPEWQLLVGLAECIPEVEWIGTVAALCEQDSDRQIAEPSPREREDPRRGGVQPLHVVDGDEHGLVSRQQAQERQEGERQRERVVRRPLGRCETKRGRKHCAVVIGKLTCEIAVRVAHQIGQAHERQRELGFHAPRGQDRAGSAACFRGLRARRWSCRSPDRRAARCARGPPEPRRRTLARTRARLRGRAARDPQRQSPPVDCRPVELHFLGRGTPKCGVSGDARPSREGQGR